MMLTLAKHNLFQIFSEILSECRPNPCFNGLCSETATGFICRCMPGFTGALCDIGNSMLAQNTDHYRPTGVKSDKFGQTA